MSKKTAKDVAELFEVLVNDVESYKIKRDNFEIDYRLLGKGILSESRYVLGKVILETLKDAIVQGDGNILDTKQDLCVDAAIKENHSSPVSDFVKDQLVVKGDKKVRKLASTSEVRWEANKKHKLVRKERSDSDKLVETGKCNNMAEVYKKEVEASQLPHAGLKSIESSMLEASKSNHFQVRETDNMQENLETMENQVKKMIPSQEAHGKVTKELLHIIGVNPRKTEEVIGEEEESEKKEHRQLSQGKESTKKKHRHVTDIEQCKRTLSSLFK